MLFTHVAGVHALIGNRPIKVTLWPYSAGMWRACLGHLLIVLVLGGDRIRNHSVAHKERDGVFDGPRHELLVDTDIRACASTYASNDNNDR